MIVECQNCDTRFQLDDERIPITGIRVRCSRCKEAFFLQHPEASRSETVDGIAADAVAQASAEPESTEDLAGSTFGDLADSPAGGFGAADVEEDWEFNHDTPDLPVEAETSESVPDAFDASGSSGLELESDSPASDSPALETTDSANGEAESDASFGSVDDFGSLSDDATAEVAAEPEEAATGSALESDIADVIDSLSSLNVDDAPPAAEETAVAGDLGEPEEWDLLGDEVEDMFGEAAEPSHMRSSVEAPAPVVPDAPQVRSVPRTAGGEPRIVERAGAALGWLAFAALFAAALYSGVMGSVPTDTGAIRYAVGSFEADGVETSWATVGGGETLLVVRGVLHNRTDSSRVVGASIAVDLLDAAGQRLDRAPALAARSLAPEELRTLAPDARRARVSTGAAALTRETVPSGGSIDFAAYFPDLPEAAQRVSVRAQQIGEGSFEAPGRGQSSAEAALGTADADSEVGLAAATTARASGP